MQRAEHHPRNRVCSDSGMTLSHGASPASSFLRGGGGRNFLLASPCKSQRPVAAMLGGSVRGRTGASGRYTCSGEEEMGHTAPLKCVHITYHSRTQGHLALHLVQ